MEIGEIVVKAAIIGCEVKRLYLAFFLGQITDSKP